MCVCACVLVWVIAYVLGCVRTCWGVCIHVGGERRDALWIDPRAPLCARVSPKALMVSHQAGSQAVSASSQE